MSGRPEHEPTDQARRQVETLAGCGIPQADIARLIDIDAKTLRKHYRDELDLGKSRVAAKIAGLLVQQALNGNLTAMIFYLKAQAGWRQADATSHREEPAENAAIQDELRVMTDEQLERARTLAAELQGAADPTRTH